MGITKVISQTWMCFIEYCEDDGIDIPEYVWSTTKIEFSMDASSIIDMACEDLHESARDSIIDENGLQKFLDDWCKKQTGVDIYIVDYKYAILVNRE